MKKVFLFFLLISNFIHAQEGLSSEIGQATLDELRMTIYDKDPSAKALVLYEHANFHLTRNNQRKFKTDYYYRIKILKKEGFKKGVFILNLTKDDKLTNVRAISYNLDENDSTSIIASELQKEKIITNKVHENLTKTILTLPNVKVGSVIEIKYSLAKTYPAIKDWHFQTDIPKIRSEISLLTPNTLEYVVRLRGMLKLSNKVFKENQKCFPKRKKKLKCNYSTFVIDSVPKFQEELLMPDPHDYRSSITFRVAKYIRKGMPDFYMINKWSEFDDQLKTLFFNTAETELKFYQKTISSSYKTGKNQLEVAKKLYSFVQDHYTWNGYKGGDTWLLAKTKFKKKNASADLIAMSLYNSLKAAGIEVHYVLLSTRGNGLPERKFPILKDFNYTIVKAVIDGTDYFLDPNDKKNSFGNVSPMALNGEARVLENEKVSRWEKIIPLKKSSKKVTVSLTINDDGEFYGKMKSIHSGYNAYFLRQQFEELGIDKYKDDFEHDLSDLVIKNFSIDNIKDIDKSIIENIGFYLENTYYEKITKKENIIRFNPILFDQLAINPFKSNERLYPLDFVFTFSNTYRITFQAPKGYKIIKTPESIGYKLPNEGGFYSIKTQASDNKATILVKLDISKSLFSNEEYYYLKELYYKIVNAESSYIELEKIDD